MTGILVRSLSGFYDVDVDGREIRCRARGKFRYQKIKPLVGDWVELTLLGETEGVVDAVLPRRNAMDRPAVANMDQLVIIASGAIPVTDPFLIDRMTAIAEAKRCEPIVLFNKWDLQPVPQLLGLYQRAGIRALACSAKTGEGLAELRQIIAGKISVFTGNSGVGKSSLLNALDTNCVIPTGEVSRRLGRGRHTTRHVELFRLPGDAMVADTPGFAAFDTQYPELLDPRSLAELFREFRPYLGECAFVDCAHVKEKGCRLLEALREGRISSSRHESYVRLYEQAKEHHTWEDK